MSKHKNKSTLGRRIRLACLAVAATAVTATGGLVAASYFVEDATAVENPHKNEAYLGFSPMSDQELDSMRGGFINFSLFGSMIYFGAEVRTTINGALTFLTTFTSPTTSETYYDPNGANTLVHPGDPVGDYVVVGPGHDITTENSNLAGLSGDSGIVFKDGNGFTAVLHSLGLGGISNTIVNEANGRDIKNQFDVHVTFENSSAFLHSIDLQQMQIDMSNLAQEMHSAFGAAH